MRRYLVFFTVSLALAFYSISGSAVAVAFPVITSHFSTSVVIAGWVLNSYQLISTIVMPLAGRVSEALGRKTTFMALTSLFTLSSVLCAIAPSIGWLIFFRVLQGLGGGGFLPCASGIVTEEFPESRQRVLGLFTSIFPIGAIIGPNLGGWMIEMFGWKSIFWFNVPLGVVVLVLSWLLLRPGKEEGAGTSIDFFGAGLLLGSLFSLMLGLTEIGSSDSGIQWIYAGTLFAVGIVFMFAFVWRERRAREPVIDLELLTERHFLAANIYNIMYGLTALGIFSLVPLYAVSVYNMGVFESGFILTARSVGTIMASVITSMYLMKWGYRRPILVGTILAALGLFLLSLELQGIGILGFHLGITPLLMIILGISGIGHGICTPASNNACIELMPEKVATITGIRGMFRQLGGVIGIAVSTILIHNVGSVQQAFFVVFFSAAVILLLAIPVIFALPASPKVNY